jgi:hypothetical protein
MGDPGGIPNERGYGLHPFEMIGFKEFDDCGSPSVAGFRPTFIPSMAFTPSTLILKPDPKESTRAIRE